LIYENGVDVFRIGEPIPFEWIRERGYTAQEEDVFCLEIDKYVPFFRFYDKNEQEVFHILINFDNSLQRWKHSPIKSIKVFSNRFKTTEGIGVGSSIEDFLNVYPDGQVSYVLDEFIFWLTTEQHQNIAFYINGFVLISNPFEGVFLEEGFNESRFLVQPSDFRENTRITGIRIFENLE
jgi:hypothetical protein